MTAKSLPTGAMASQVSVGSIAQVRSRQYLIENVEPPSIPEGDTTVRLVCLEDDAQGEELEVFWEREIDAQVIGTGSWDVLARQGFDNPRYFSAYLHTLRWNCVTSTQADLFQAHIPTVGKSTDTRTTIKLKSMRFSNGKRGVFS
ncbi:hypothetical protein [Halothece sp. PCC 7418]|uniref:hypothetical protein n=1 Tax=Halothece sp. (strain PCC 7418) TaxID=65093 RepID=UPI0002D7B428|nr:hypothetical protein [Halothece sp. PCC 7418]